MMQLNLEYLSKIYQNNGRLVKKFTLGKAFS
jgi:hypothetical protein